MLTAAFDASGHERDQRFLAVAGFVSSAEDWIEFTACWNERLKKDGIPLFHATACENNTNEFWGWGKREDAKRKLKEDLIEVIHRYAYRMFASAVEIKNMGILSEETRNEFGMRAYALAGRTCAARVRQWAESWAAKYSPELVFEEGDIGCAELETRLVEDGFSRPSFRPKRDRQEPNGQLRAGFVPLQAADFMAYEAFRAIKAGNDSRWEFQGLIRKPGHFGFYTIKDMHQLEANMRARLEELRQNEQSWKDRANGAAQ